jgi:SAM-dependent methyltransferase
MDHLDRITDEFSRQANAFEVWAQNVDAEVGARFAIALGDAARGRLIDIACGPGVVTAALAPGAASVVACDATAQMLEKAKARCTKAGVRNVEFKSGDAENLPFADAQFDGAVTRAAVRKAYKAHSRYQRILYGYGERSLLWARENNAETVILAGRPYHADPEINHGIHKLLNSLGCVVLSEDCLRPRKKFNVNVLNQWTYHSRLYAAATFVTENSGVQLVQLISFGCGLDAITSDEVKDILEKGKRIYTLIKIDEINNLGAAKIRLRSLMEAVKSNG